jgi:hypothetical protein
MHEPSSMKLTLTRPMGAGLEQVSRYIVASGRSYVETPLYDDQRESLRPDLSVDGAKEVRTGLVTAKGEPIMRIAPPIGFGRDGEW